MTESDLAKKAKRLSVQLWTLVSDAAHGDFEGTVEQNENVKDLAEALTEFTEAVISRTKGP